ncbi:MAG: tetratricopeptide repeat protein [Bacteroides sp.]|nr:tetratricopeptide repeat protein [Bacteroides sp.]
MLKEKDLSSEEAVLKAQALKSLFLYTEATAVLQQALQHDPENIKLLIETAECLRSSGNQQEAAALYRQALTLEPDNKYIRLHLIRLSLFTEDYETARQECNTLLQTDSSSLAYRLLGECYENMQLPDSTLLCYHQAILHTPTDHQPIARAANIYINQEAYEKALELTETYREKDSLNILVNQLNAKAYCLSKQYTPAQERYEKLVELGDRSYLTHYYLGVSYYMNELFYEAHEYLSKAHQKDPWNVNLLYYLGRACSKTSWKEEGIEYLEKALEYTIPTDDTLAGLYKGLADCYKLNHQYRDQIEALRLAYRYDPKYKSALYHIGLIYQDKLKENIPAARYFKEFLRTEPADSKEIEFFDEETGAMAFGEAIFYRATEKRLQKIREEEFMKGNRID